MIGKFIKTLNKAGFTHLTPGEIADIIWLAGHLEEEERDTDSGDLPRNDIQNSESPQKEAVSPEPPAETEMPGTGIYRPESEDTEVSGPGMGAIPFRSPGTPALPGELSIARSFRPLMRRMPSRTHFVLDEEATVRRIADEDNWIPAYRPALSRWLDVVLVVDEWSSMVIWRQTIAELQRLLERQGAFRNVQTWGFSTEGEAEPMLHLGTGFEASENMARSPRELTDPCGLRLILVVSDCVSPAWYDGRVARMMENWTHNTMVTVLQMLPYRLWGRTGLGKATSVYLRSLNPGTVNSKLEAESTRKIFRKKVPQGGVKVPVITLEPGSIELWAKSLAGMGSLWIPGVVFQAGSDEQRKKTVQEMPQKQETALSPEEQIQLFRATASPTARHLAGYLAAAPLSLPVMRLVQRVMLPESRQIHLAEVFLSGLIERLSPDDPSIHPDAIQYEFADGVRERLLRTILISESVRVIEEVFKEVSKFISENIGKPLDFEAVLADPSMVDEVLIREESQAFANVGASVLRRLGGRYAGLAKRLEDAVISGKSGGRRELPKRLTNSLGMEFVYIPPGTFMMGSPEDEPWRSKNETLHQVTLTRGFYMQTTQVTQGQWEAVMGNNPSHFKDEGDNCPVEKVSWDDVQEFIKKLDERERTDKYRLPTEAEWEYSCRARSRARYCFGDDKDRLSEYAWYWKNSGRKTHPVGEKKANAWGLYDMHGNVWEWCEDWYDKYPSESVTDPGGPSTGSYRVYRGGSWHFDAGDCRSAYRIRSSPNRRTDDLGLRLALSPGQQVS